jgi:hypothetical protein
MTLLMTFYMVLLAACGYTLLRNHEVCRVRIAFINAGGLWDGTYEALPSYDAMLFHPKYQLLWTATHWRNWVGRSMNARQA